MTSEVILAGFDYDILDLLLSCDCSITGYLDKKKYDVELDYLGTDNNWQDIKEINPSAKVVISIDNCLIREKVANFISITDLKTCISPQAYISNLVNLGVGNLVQHGVKIMPKVNIGNNCLFNVNSAVHHESVIGDHSILAPGAIILGRVILHERVYIGAGAIVKQNCKIGRGSIIGAGAVVVNDIPDNSMVVGVPANRYLDSKENKFD